jgi:hypothetical protein
MNEFEGLLDDMGEQIASGSRCAESKETFEKAFDTFLGRAFRTGEGEADPHPRPAEVSDARRALPSDQLFGARQLAQSSRRIHGSERRRAHEPRRHSDGCRPRRTWTHNGSNGNKGKLAARRHRRAAPEGNKPSQNGVRRGSE